MTKLHHQAAKGPWVEKHIILSVKFVQGSHLSDEYWLKNKVNVKRNNYNLFNLSYNYNYFIHHGISIVHSFMSNKP